MATKKTTTIEKGVGKSADVAVLKHPRITEKAANGASMSVYLFDVAVHATKSEIAKAFQAMYKYKPIKVNTVTVMRKTYFRRGKLGFGTKGKKAYVYLPKGTTVDIG